MTKIKEKLTFDIKNIIAKIKKRKEVMGKKVNW
jgi:hypothetical protein